MRNKGFTFIELLIVVAILFIIFALCPFGCGVGGCGPRNTVETTVISKHIDHSKDESHYMVITEAGGFEVDNGFLLGVSNADEIYGRMKEGRQYRITTKGKRWVNFAFQHYPYIIKVEEMPR
jgi:prepilin-type N-terminal cleavage/methylation domain-containing protein